MRIYFTQNLYGIIVTDGIRVTGTWKYNILANGIAAYDSHLYVGDWSSILKIDNDGKIIDTIHVDGWDNIHTVNFFNDQLLVASTSNDTVFLGSTPIFKPRDIGISKFIYINAAIPYGNEHILISARNTKQTFIYDVENRRVINTITLGKLRNQHHPTPYYDDFLVSDNDGVVRFDKNGNMLSKSPQMYWPRGIKVMSRTKVYVVDRDGLIEYNPVTNRINRKIYSPIDKPTTQSGTTEQGAAMFDLAIL